MSSVYRLRKGNWRLQAQYTDTVLKYQTGALNNRYLFLTALEADKSKVKVLADSMISLFLSLKTLTSAQGPTLTTSSNPHYFPKTPTSICHAPGVRASTYELGEHNSVHGSTLASPVSI